MQKVLVDLKNICKSFGDTEVLHDFNLYIMENEFVTLLGPSGCGKTTLLRMIGGFDSPTSGDIYFDGKLINGVEPNKREINTVFQRYALFPHLNVFDNVAFGLKLKKMEKSQIKEEVEAALKLVKLEGFEDRKIDTLSGGQMQRIAMARAIVCKPKLLLLDEPLAALDLKLRQDMQYELKEMQKKLGITFIYVTHDQEEALTMSDTIVVMNEGRILQIGTPEMIYNEPKTRFVANFIGESNIVEGKMLKDYLVKFEGASFECVDNGFSKNEDVDVVIRPEDLEIIDAKDAKIKGVIDSKTFKGVHHEINIIVNDKEYTVHTTKDYPLGIEVGLTVSPENIQIMKKPGLNTFSGVMDYDGKVKISDNIVLDSESELEEGTAVVVRILTGDVLLDDIDESDFKGTIKDIKKRGIYSDVYVESENIIFVSSTSKVHHVGDEVGVWIKPEKVKLEVEEDEGD
ncbi:MAG: ABC transporter ATP-binding protein [Bacillales bacterium]|nr:ABC transporter ATP-binding protein [Bacillales bacterium]